MKELYILKCMTYSLMFVYYIWMSVKEWKKIRAADVATDVTTGGMATGATADMATTSATVTSATVTAVTRDEILFQLVVLTILLVIIIGK